MAVLWEQHTFDDCLWRGKRFTCEYTNTTDPAIHEGEPAPSPQYSVLGVAGEIDKQYQESWTAWPRRREIGACAPVHDTAGPSWQKRVQDI